MNRSPIRDMTRYQATRPSGILRVIFQDFAGQQSCYYICSQDTPLASTLPGMTAHYPVAFNDGLLYLAQVHIYFSHPAYF